MVAKKKTTKKSIPQKEMEMLFPESKNVEIAGTVYTIKPFNFVQTRMVVKALGGTVGYVPMLISDDGVINLDVATKVLDESFDGICKIISMCLNIDVSDVEQFDNTSALKAITNIIEVNKEFFFHSTAGEITNLKTTLGLEEIFSSVK